MDLGPYVALWLCARCCRCWHAGHDGGPSRSGVVGAGSSSTSDLVLRGEREPAHLRYAAGADRRRVAGEVRLPANLSQKLDCRRLSAVNCRIADQVVCAPISLNDGAWCRHGTARPRSGSGAHWRPHRVSRACSMRISNSSMPIGASSKSITQSPPFAVLLQSLGLLGARTLRRANREVHAWSRDRLTLSANPTQRVTMYAYVGLDDVGSVCLLQARAECAGGPEWTIAEPGGSYVCCSFSRYAQCRILDG